MGSKSPAGEQQHTGRLQAIIRSLRRKIEPAPRQPRYIRTLWKGGYMVFPREERHRP